MRFNTRVSGQLQTGVAPKIDPKIVLGSQILQLNQVELEHAVESELTENPALERIEEFEEPVTQEEILKSIAPDEVGPQTYDYELERSLPRDSDQSTDWVDFARSEESLSDHLSAQLFAQLDEELHPLATYMIGSLDDRGYFKSSVEEAALDCNVSLEEAEMVFAALRDCEPEGVGATDLRDCLLLQLRTPATLPEKLARRMVEHDWEDLVARNARAIMRRYKVDDETVQDAFEVILSLNPFPGEAFRGLGTAPRSTKTAGALPDVSLKRDEQGWHVEIPGPSATSLRISRAYQARFNSMRSNRSESQEKRHIAEYVERANRFLDALSQRRRHMLMIAQYLIERQSGYLMTGDFKFLQALTRSQMAKDLKLHESTISRATNGKFLQIATGEVVSFDVLFRPALRIQKIIEEILETENPDNPLSDERISQILAERGIHVARRTVNKYRDRNKLLSSRHRRSA